MSQVSHIAADVRHGRKRARELVEATLTNISALQPELNCFLEVPAEEARAAADSIDQRVRAGAEVGVLAGVPIAVKDNICVSGVRTTCGSRMLADFRPPYDATVISRLRAADAIIVAKTNLDEFAMGSSTENSAFAPSRNPWDLSRVPGGTSGGSAAAVASNVVSAALGSDTGGSVRQPAAFCGVVGLKPSYGRVSRYGLVAHGSSLDQIGPIARTVADAALLLHVIAGPDAQDSTCAAREPPDWPIASADAALGRHGPLRVGVPREYFGDGLDREVAAAIEDAVGIFERAGAQRVDVALPHAEHAVAAYYLISTAEASSNLARFDGVHYGQRAQQADGIVELYSRSRAAGLGREVQRRIMLGTFALSAGYHDAYYDKALRVRRLIAEDFARAFESVDLIIGPVTPTPAFKLGEKSSDPLQMYLADIYTVSANLAGIPAISVPAGYSRSGLPIGLQIQARAFDETGLLSAAALFERETRWVEARKPPITCL